MRYKFNNLFIVIIFMFASWSCCICQELNMDSLIQIISGEKDDTNKIINLLEISRKFGRTYKMESLKLCNQAEELSSDLNYGKGIAQARFEKSIIYMKSGNLDTAVLFNQKSMKINDSLKIFNQLAHNYNLMGILLLDKNELESAKEYFNKSLFYFKIVKDSTGINIVNNSLGSLHQILGNYDSAAHYFINFIKLCDKVGREEQKGVGMVNLANVYLLLQDYNRATEYSLMSLENNQIHNRPDCVVKAYKYLAIINAKQKQYTESEKYYDLGIKLAQNLADISELSSLYINYGNFYEEQDQLDNALIYYEKAFQLSLSINNTVMLANIMINKGLIYERKENYGKALILYDSAVKILEGSGNYYELSSVYYNIFKIYEKKNDYKNAFIYQSNYHSLKDSTLNLESKKLIADITMKYEKEKDQAKILFLENKNLQQNLSLRKRTYQKNILLFCALGLGVIVVLTFFYYQQKTSKNKIIAEQKINQLEEEKKLLAVRSLVNGQEEERKRIAKDLHDGLGVLLSTAKMQFSSIKDKSPENKSLIEKATKLLEQATGDVRRISHNMMPGILSRFGFYEAVDDLFEQINDSHGPKAEIQIEGETTRLPENIEIMLYRIVQEMVNNTLKYASAKNVSMIIKVLQDHLYMQFSDDGKGFNVQEKSDSKTIGINNILSRVKFLNGNASIESIPGKGCTYFIQIPISLG